MGSSVVICIPAFNEEKNIKRVVDASKIYGDVVVFNNNSKDNTEHIARKCGATIIPVIDQGYDCVIESISNFFRYSEYSKLIIVDGDGEVGLDYIEKSINLLDKYDAVIGSRPSIKRYGEKVICLLFKYLYKVDDIYCGFKCFTRIGINPKYVKKSFGTSIFNKGTSIFNQPVTLVTREDKSKLGDGLYLNYQLFISGIRGLFL